MSVYISYQFEGFSLSPIIEKTVIEVIEKLLFDYRLANGEVGIIIADDATLEELNRLYRSKNGPTDVLSFSYLEGESIEGKDVDEDFAVGDIFISLDRASEQAVENEHSLEQELLLLILHGVLHLTGFDHGSWEDSRIMKLKEQDLLKIFEPLLSGGEIDE